ncbi:prepilin-type N-terminal cleavage/methylation domain-containing protein [bacterium]|nr:prepilin-type N-terminal cleavage/methylation domain-containing protein [bacterium]
MKRNAKGFTLIELLIVVAIIGIIVAIAIPNLLNAIQRAKQRRTMGDIRTSATAIEAYAVDMNRYPPSAGSYDLPVGLTTATTVGANMYKYVSPTYVKAIPLSDGWNSWFLYATDSNGTIYALFSGAKDGTAAGIGGTPIGPTTDFNADIVYANGSFLQWPEGVQR